jgi:hypothetical protein
MYDNISRYVQSCDDVAAIEKIIETAASIPEGQ